MNKTPPLKRSLYSLYTQQTLKHQLRPTCVLDPRQIALPRPQFVAMIVYHPGLQWKPLLLPQPEALKT